MQVAPAWQLPDDSDGNSARVTALEEHHGLVALRLVYLVNQDLPNSNRAAGVYLPQHQISFSAVSPTAVGDTNERRF